MQLHGVQRYDIFMVFLFQANDEFITYNCGMTCRCEGGSFFCSDYGPCGQNAECIIQDGQRGCYCKNGYSGDGFECTGM